MTQLVQNKPSPPLTELEPKLDKRGCLSFAFDGQYKFARYYAPANLNTPVTLEQILRNNYVRLFELSEEIDPLETCTISLSTGEKTKTSSCA